MSLPKINLVFVGHKDHGKSTLIGRLLYDSEALTKQKLQEIKDELKSGGKEFEFAFILDSLEEERTGGLTIDIMQTPFESEKYFYTIIDCPGHREFIQKMLTGASQADAAVLLASIEDGIQAQTKQHLFLVKILGIRQLVVVASKMDTVDYSEPTFRRFSQELRAMLNLLGYKDVPIVPVSAFKGENVTKPTGMMPWYKEKPLIEALDEIVQPPQPLEQKPLRCVIQDVYRVEGQDIAACRVETGTLKVGQTVLVMPVTQKGIIERIESFGETTKEAYPGDSVGVVMKWKGTPKRGYVLASSEMPLSETKTFAAELIIFDDLMLEVGDKIMVRLGTADTECKVEKILERIDAVKLTVVDQTPEYLDKGDVGKLVLRPVEPLYVEEYSSVPELGRFVVVGKRGAVAAGIVLDKN